MHPELAKLLARYHDEALLDEAENERLAVIARGRRGRQKRPSGPGGAAPWRRSIGWAVIELGIRLAGGSVAPATGRR